MGNIFPQKKNDNNYPRIFPCHAAKLKKSGVSGRIMLLVWIFCSADVRCSVAMILLCTAKSEKHEMG
jgi:hypothetical protein